MSIKVQIQADLKTAMREKDALRRDTLRMLSSAIKQREIDGQEADLDGHDAEVMAIVEKLIKQRRDASTQYRDAGREALAEKEDREVEILKVYLPEPMSDAEVDTAIAAAITETGATEMKDMGRVMGQLKAALAGRADMGQVSKKVREKLGS